MPKTKNNNTRRTGASQLALESRSLAARLGRHMRLLAKRIARRLVAAAELGRGQPEGGVLDEEIRGAQRDADGLGGHDGEVLGAGEVGEAELDVADNVGVGDGAVARGPVGHGRVVRVAQLALRLRHVVAGREDAPVLIGHDPQRVLRKRRALPHHAARFGENAGRRRVEDLVGDGFACRRVQLAGVGDVPGPARLVAVVGGAGLGGEEGRLFAVEAVAVEVLGRAERCLGRDGVVLHHRVVGPVDFRVDAEGEDVLVVVGSDSPRHLCAVGGGSLRRVQAVRVEHARQLHLELVGAVEVEDVVKGVVVVCGGDDLRDDELAVASRDGLAVAVVGVLEREAVVLLVDADGVLDEGGLAGADGQDGVQVVDGALAVAAERQRVAHEARAVLAHVEGVLLVVGRAGVAVGDDHLDDADAIEEGALPLLVLVKDPDVGEDDALAVVEADVHLVAGPRQLVAAHAERDALGLGDIDRLQPVVAVAGREELWGVVVLGQRRLGALAVNVADVDGEHDLLLGVDDDGEVERVGVLIVVGRVAVVD